MIKQKVILNQQQFNHIIYRLCCQIIENHQNLIDTVIIGVQPRGIHLAQRLVKILSEKWGIVVENGSLDVTFFRDDFRHHDKPLTANSTQINTVIEGKNVILIDDVLFTGRTIRSAFDALLAFGRPKKIELLVLVNRHLMREMPIQADYVGITIDTLLSQKVKVHWKEIENENEDIVALYN
jgi:pyrimidine operon attenuation protein/uracil phosphoribosyltransferase